MPEGVLTPVKVNVTIFGSEPTVVTMEGRGTVADVVAQGAEALGVEINPDRVAFVRNGEQVAPETPVQDQDVVTAAPRVANG